MNDPLSRFYDLEPEDEEQPEVDEHRWENTRHRAMLRVADVNLGLRAYKTGLPRKVPTLQLLGPNYLARRASWLAGWDRGKELTVRRQRETIAAAIAGVMEEVEAYGQEMAAHRAEDVVTAQVGRIGAAVRVLIQAVAQAPDVAKEVTI